ncbi:MAG: hypothetical protein HUK03_10295, partial [Bacteroidaceae bacterium]|nr:hypothetical protein [Bacteroidaceae bacterium]
KKSGRVGFYKATPNTFIAAGKAYLVSGSGINALYFDDETAITTPDSDTAPDDAPVYNMLGQKVGDAYKGVVVKRGRKILR